MSSSELKPIVLYDIPCFTPGRPWSPNTMKTRYCLGYKQLPFTTIWVELPDIAGLLQSKGITQPPYTLPAIEDPNTGMLVVDSLAIAAYLDETYPDTPKVLSPAARATLEGVLDVFSFGTGGPASAGPNKSANPGAGASADGDGSDHTPRLVFIVLAAERLNPVSKNYYHRKRTEGLGERWTAISSACAAGPDGRAEKVSQGIDAIREVWRKMSALYDLEGELFALGEEPCLIDFSIAGRIKFIVDGLTPPEAETLANLEGGNRLGRLVESLEKYYKY